MTELVRLVGQTVGQYKIVEQIGQAGMATVFKADQPGLNHNGVEKVSPSYVAEKPGFIERFTHAVQAMGTICFQLQLPGAKQVDGKRTGRLSANVDEQGKRLGDLLEAMDKVSESIVSLSE